MLAKQTKGRVIICVNSNLVIRQMRGEIDCKASALITTTQSKGETSIGADHKFLHNKRNCNQSVDRLASAALKQEKGKIITLDKELNDLMMLN